MFSPYPESFTPAFCAEAPEAESVDAMQTFPVDCWEFSYLRVSFPGKHTCNVPQISLDLRLA